MSDNEDRIAGFISQKIMKLEAQNKILTKALKRIMRVYKVRDRVKTFQERNFTSDYEITISHIRKIAREAIKKVKGMRDA